MSYNARKYGFHVVPFLVCLGAIACGKLIGWGNAIFVCVCSVVVLLIVNIQYSLNTLIKCNGCGKKYAYKHLEELGGICKRCSSTYFSCCLLVSSKTNYGEAYTTVKDKYVRYESMKFLDIKDACNGKPECLYNEDMMGRGIEES